MDKQIVQKILRIGAYTAPLLALSSIAPVYLFRQVPIDLIGKVFLILSIVSFIYFLSNAYIFTGLRVQQEWHRYAASFIAAILAQIIFLWFAPGPENIRNGTKYSFLYPILIMMATNTVVIMMVRTVVIGQKKDSAEREVERLQLHNLESQKQMLMQQLQPHFLFNTLSVLKSLIKEDPDAAENYAIQLSDFLRYSVQGHNKSLVTLEEELNFTRDYIQLQQLRFGNAFDCNIQTTTDIDGYKLPTYALQLLVENAIKHNAFTEKRPLKINIVQNGKSVSVCNNKLPVKMTTAGTGTGLSNLMERYQLIANKKVLIEDKTEQFCVHIDLI